MAAPKLEQRPAADTAPHSRDTSPARPLSDSPLTDEASAALKLREQAVEEQFLRRAEASVHTREKMVAQSEKQVNDCNWIDSLAGTKAALQKDVQAEKRQLELEQNKLHEIQAALEKAEALRVKSADLRKAGNSAEANDLISQAQKILGGINGDVDRKEYMAALAAENRMLDASVKNLDTSIKVAKIVRDGAVVTGATIATGGVFAGAAAGTSIFVVGAEAIAVGTATGTGIGLVSNTAGAIEEGVTGDKSAKELAQQVLRETGKDAVNSFVASASTAATMGVGNSIGGTQALKTLTSGLGQTGSKIASSAIGGAITGAANGTFTVTAQTAVRFTEAKLAFSKMAAENHWTGAERDAKYEQYLESQGLTAKQLLKTGGIQVLASTAGGAVGGGSAAVQQSIKTGVGRVFVTGAGIAADGGISVGAAALQGDASKERIAQILGATLAGHAIGYVAQKAELSREPKLEKGVDLLAERTAKDVHQEFTEEMGKAVCKERGLEPTPENIKLAREQRIARAGEEGALKTLDRLGTEVEKGGASALTAKNVEKVSEAEMEKVTEKLCRDYNLDKITEKHTYKMLQEVSTSSNKKLAATLEGLGLSNAEALETAKLVKSAVSSGRYDAAIKQKLEDKITDLVSADLKQGMETSFKQTLKAGLSGESKAPEAQHLQQAMRDKNIKLKDDEINELTEAGWRGAQRGIERGVRTVVREGIDSAFDKFRKRGAKEDGASQAQTLAEHKHRDAEIDPKTGREQAPDPLKAGKEMEAAAEQSFQLVEEVSLAGQRYERTMMRDKHGHWQQVGLHLVS